MNALFSVVLLKINLLTYLLAGVASRNDAYIDVVYWVPREADEGIMCEYAAHCKLFSADVLWQRLITQFFPTLAGLN